MPADIIPIYREAESLQQSALIDLWEFDFLEQGGDILRFCNQTNEKGEAVVWNGKTYDQLPIEGEGFQLSSKGSSNRPSLNAANITGIFTALSLAFNQFVGVRVRRRQVFSRFLDAVNFEKGNPEADPMQEVVTQYVIERMRSLTAKTVSFELSAPTEGEGAIFPSRMILAGVCNWEYRGGPNGLSKGCPYRGGPVADRYDMPTNDIKKDYCSGSLLGCKARFGATAVLPIGAFISADKINL